MKRALKISIATAFVLCTTLLATLVAALFWFGATESGTQFVWRHAQTFLPPSVEIRTIEGRLAGPLALRGVKITHTAFVLEMERFDLEWQPWQLWNRVLDIERIAVEGVRYTQLEGAPEKAKEESSPPTLPEHIEIPLGIDLRIGEASLRDFKFNSAKDSAPFEISSGRLTGWIDSQKIEISSLSVDSPQFNVKGNAALKTHGDFPLQGELEWQVPVPDYPALDGHTRLHGTLREITIAQSIAKPYDIQGTVQLKNPVENLAFDVSLFINPLELQTLNNELPPLTMQMAITGSGTPDDIKFNLDGWTEDPNMGRFNTVLTGGLESGTVTIETLKVDVAQQPAQVTASGDIALNEVPKLNLVFEWEQLQWPLQGDPLLTSPLGSLKLNGTWEKLHAVLDIAVGDMGRIEGWADRQDDTLDIALLWRDLQWPLQQPTVTSSTGHITLGGKIDAYTFKAQAEVDVPQQTDAKILLQGNGSRKDLQVANIDISTLGGSIEGTAGLNWTPELQGNIHLSGQELNPEGILQDWPGKLGFSLQAQAGMDNGHPNLQVEHLSTRGQLRGYAVALNAAGSYADNIATLKRLVLSSGESEIKVNGTLSDILDIDWKIQSNDLDSLLPGAKGRLSGNGGLNGPLKQPRIAATLNADELIYQNYRLKSLSLDAEIDVSGNTQSRVLLHTDKGYAAGIELQKLVFSASGTPEAHTLTLEADTSKGAADIALQGDLKNPWHQEMIWNFNLNQAELSYPGLDAWILQKSAGGQISIEEAMLAESCWKSGEALLCLKGKRSANKVEANFTLSDLPFSYLSPYLPPDLEVQGSLGGHGRFAQSGENHPFANIALKSSAIHLLSRTTHNTTEQVKDDLIIKFQPADFSMHMEHGGLEAQAELPLSPSDRIAFTGSISGGQSSLVERELNAEITTIINDLDFIAALSPEVQNLSGSLNGNMSITGSLEAPVMRGKLALLKGAAELDRPGLDLKDIQVELSGEGANGLRLNAHAASGEGELNIAGTYDLQGNADMDVKGENFRVINTLEAQIDASPDLSITLRPTRIDVGGELVIPRGRITLKELPESAVKVSEDQVIIESEEEVKETTSKEREIYARVRTILGDNVHFEGFGLKARIQGELLVIDRPGEPTAGSGELNIVDGEYRAYGQGLVIQRGRILFPGGPIDQPGLDVRAIRRPKEGITVGVQVRGRLQQPDFTLFSDPGMTQGNQLSYLVLGRPLSGTSGTEGSALSRASLALGLKGGNAVAEKIGGSLGLDQFGLAQSEAGSDSSPENASFVIGKYLSPKLYVSYGLGLFNQTSTLQLQYTISKHWKFMTESSSEASGADLIYTIETGK
ncbi:MAG: translocation/assembly module TamB domain-containing protein [Thermodesulfobacteriota bacterium]